MRINNRIMKSDKFSQPIKIVIVKDDNDPQNKKLYTV